MRDFSKISPAVWVSKKFLALPNEKAKLAYLFVLTGPHQTNCGVGKIPPAYAAHDLGWESEEVSIAFQECEEAGLIERDEETHEIFVTNWFKHNTPMNVKHRKGIVHSLERVESKLLYEIGITELEKVYFDPDAKGPNTPPKEGETIELDSSDADRQPQPQVCGTVGNESHEDIVNRMAMARKGNNQFSQVANGMRYQNG